MNGHRVVEFEDGSQRVFMRGNHENLQLEVGDYFPPLTEVERFAEVSNALGSSNEEMESGQSSLGQQEGSESQEAVSSGSDNVEREAGSEEGQEGIPEQEG